MKKIYTIIASLVICFAANSQTNTNSVSPNAPRHQAIATPKLHYENANRAFTPGLVINYDSADAYNTVTLGTGAGTYQHNQIQDFNMHYSWPADSSAAYSDPCRYATVGVDSIFDPFTYTSYSHSQFSHIRVDSMFLVVGQENNSGQPDTLVTEIVSVGANGYPTSTVLWSNSLIIPANASLSLSGAGAMNNWLYGAVVALAPNLTVASNYGFAVNIKYYGNKLDTFGLQYGFSYFMAGCNGQVGPYHLANKTAFSNLDGTTLNANSYAFHINRNLGGASGTTFPQNASNGFLFYNCDGVAGFTAGVDGADYLENFTVQFNVTLDPQLSVSELNNNFTLFQNEPNPFTNQTLVKYQLKKAANNVAIEIYDIRGVKVYENTEKNVKPGSYTLDVNSGNFAAGVYFCSLVVDGEKVTNKIVKQ